MVVRVICRLVVVVRLVLVSRVVCAALLVRSRATEEELEAAGANRDPDPDV